MAWTDSHCHIPYHAAGPGGGSGPDLIGPEVIDAARLAGVTRLVTVGTDAARTRACIDVARAYEGVWATAGLHPHDATQGAATIVPLLDAPEVVAVGECGLDYHYEHSPRAVQREAFAAQVALAHEHDLALVIHTREAWDDTFDVLAAEGVPARTVFHCFTGGPEEARRALGTGAHLSFSGIVTFRNAGDVRGAAALCPLDRLLVETDAPYLAPVPHRGRRNEPANLPAVGAGVAAAKDVPVEAVEEASWRNAEAVFRLAPAAG